MQWLIRLLLRLLGRGDEIAHEFYLPKERLVYRYEKSQGEWVSADPILLWKRLMEVAPGLRADMATAELPSKFADIAQERALDAIRGIFDVKPLDGEGKGLTQDETLELFDHYLIWTQRLKKAGSRFATFFRKSADSNLSSVESPATSSSSESGSTESDSNTDQPQPSPSEPESPSAASSPETTTGEQPATESKKPT